MNSENKLSYIDQIIDGVKFSVYAFLGLMAIIYMESGFYVDLVLEITKFWNVLWMTFYCFFAVNSFSYVLALLLTEIIAFSAMTFWVLVYFFDGNISELLPVILWSSVLVLAFGILAFLLMAILRNAFGSD